MGITNSIAIVPIIFFPHLQSAILSFFVDQHQIMHAGVCKIFVSIHCSRVFFLELTKYSLKYALLSRKFTLNRLEYASIEIFGR